jgi:hypothetical protein
MIKRKWQILALVAQRVGVGWVATPHVFVVAKKGEPIRLMIRLTKTVESGAIALQTILI